MSQFTQKKCPTCGGRLELVSGNKYECRCCHNVYTMNEENTSLYDALQTASVFRESLNFKQAEMLYKNMLKKYADDDLSDVYWNLLLCEQRVMFETDQNGEQFPSFYDISSTEIDESEYYGKAMEYAQEYDTSKLMCFVDLANKMQEAKAKYRTIKNSTKPYEIFICFKKSDIQDQNKLTKDYQFAYDLYNHLSSTYRVFFSERSLDNIVVREYEPNIYHALYTSKIMLVICSDINYLNSQWVKNEWSRFKMMTRTSAQAKSIIPIFIDGFSPEQLPDELRSCQGYNNDMYLMQRLDTAIKTIISPVDREAEIAASLEAKMKAQMETQMKTQMEAFAKQFASNTSRPVSVDADAVNYIVPYGTTSIQDSQFKDRKDIINVVIPDTVIRIGNLAFDGCIHMQSITIPNSVTSIGYQAFHRCTSLLEISIPNGVKHIGWKVFESCTDLRKATLPEKLENIGSYAFAYCGKLTSINIPDTVTMIGDWAFDGCYSLTRLNLPNGISRIDNFAFSGCRGLSEIRIPNSLSVIPEKAFFGCKNITKAIIPRSVRQIGKGAFFGCEKLTDIHYEGTTEEWNAIKKYTEPDQNSKNNWNSETGKYTVHCLDGDLISSTSIKDNEFAKREDIKFFEIPNGTIKIGVSAFAQCTNLERAIFPETVTEIDNMAFTGCTQLNNVTLPNSLVKLGYGIFCGCLGLTCVTIGNKLTYIGDTMFASCQNLLSITIPNNIIKIGYHAFADTGIKNIKFPNNLTTIGRKAFARCSNLTQVELFDKLTKICDGAFYQCKNLTDIIYHGTKKQWKSIVKEKDWDKGTGKYIVHCTDGDLKKSIFS